MKLQFLKIVLWPRNAALSPRVVSFAPGRLNVITGASKTGKSAIIPIIDYCLGSDSCSIPVNTIRDACSWFGVVIQLDGSQILLARREPGAQKSTGDMYVAEGVEVAIPTTIGEKNSTAEAVKLRLDELAGLTKLDFAPENRAEGFKGRPSFRDMAAFMFQPQNIVANPDVLFYKADTYEHREKLRSIFPYVLGAVTARILALQHQLAALRADLRTLEREKSLMVATTRRWVEDLENRVSTALELGLLTERPRKEAPASELVELFRAILGRHAAPARITESSVSGAVEELMALEREENQVAEHLALLRRRLSEMVRLRETASYYGQALRVKRERLQLSEWITNLYGAEKQCPLCGGDDAPHEDELRRLTVALQAAEREAGSFGEMPASFEREFVRVSEDVRHTTDALEAVRYRRQQRASASQSLKSRYFTEQSAQRFLGATQEAIDRFDSVMVDRDSDERIAEISEQVRDIERELERASIQSNLQRALARISNINNTLVPRLDVERPNDAVQLDIDELSLKVSSLQRDDFLWELGSGANWVGYHVAMSLALQRFFCEQKSSPVPSVLVFDQPSQVYFPRRLAARDDDDLDPRLERDEDVAAVRKIFEVIGKETADLQGCLQTIVLDHATSEIWGHLSNVVLVEEWRDGRKLVPQEWIDAT